MKCKECKYCENIGRANKQSRLLCLSKKVLLL